MRIIRDINRWAIAALTIMVLFMTPIAAASDAHVCCPDMSASISRYMSQDLVSHYQHISGADTQDHSSDTFLANMPTDTACDIACCGNVAASSMALPDLAFPADWAKPAQHLMLASVSGASAADCLNTPPPRTS